MKRGTFDGTDAEKFKNKDGLCANKHTEECKHRVDGNVMYMFYMIFLAYFIIFKIFILLNL